MLVQSSIGIDGFPEQFSCLSSNYVKKEQSLHLQSQIQKRLSQRDGL